jgi:hypothetical protein
LSAAKKRNTLWIERNLVRRQKLLLSCQKCATDVFCFSEARCMFAVVGGGGKSSDETCVSQNTFCLFSGTRCMFAVEVVGGGGKKGKRSDRPRA